MATDYKALGKRISNARKQAGITQEALGEQLNMTRKHISVIEFASAKGCIKSICSPLLRIKSHSRSTMRSGVGS